ncbi:MAG: SurA N-terminal domain-containing protein [Gammaproteobacteria bacterium]|uniref:Periplasmic chaperone PpiD n=1 Tax=Candidatus Thiopontia autotrophica TaxID=2841688 RepID=A0A8J6P7E6_9GAMM|nr:SurA N-terminal domain-containing protein [Candidatus Thiopontia autotrophica]MBL6968691.1 SurA N-terminal domain-containing protein [Gammaproteobacteria bacterium]
MLQSIHDQAQSWVAWVIVGLLIIPFALWGINSYFDGGSGAVVAEVNGTEISLNEYQRSLQQQRQRMRQLMGADYRPEMLEDPRMRRAVLDAMIENDLLNQAVDGDGFRIGDELLYWQLQRTEAFRGNDDKFSQDIYKQVLSSQGMSQPFFESRIRSDLMQSQLLTGFRQASFVTESELREAVRLQEQKRSLRLLTIPASVDRIESKDVGDDEIAAQYEINSVAYEIPEQVSLDYISLSVADLAGDVPVEVDALQKLYEQRKESLLADEERHARHILIELAEGADEEATAAAQARLNEVQAKLAAGDSFEALAEHYSDDPGSAAAGGDLDFFPRGMMVPEFDDAVFSMQVGEVSEPVRTPFGFHLIRLDEIQAEEIRTFEDVRGELSAELKRQTAEDLFFEYAETIANLAYEQPDSLDGAAEAAGLVVRQSELFNRQGATNGVATNPGVIKAAFSDMVLVDGKNSDPIELSEDHMVVVRVREHRPATRKPLERVRAEVVDAILAQRARATAKNSGMELLDKIQSGAVGTDAAAESVALQWSGVEQINRSDKTISSEVVARAFQVNLLKGQKAYAGTELRGGGYALIELLAVEDGSFEAMGDKQVEVMRRELADRNVKSHYQSYVASLRNQADIKVYEDQLN